MLWKEGTQACGLLTSAGAESWVHPICSPSLLVLAVSCSSGSLQGRKGSMGRLGWQEDVQN